MRLGELKNKLDHIINKETHKIALIEASVYAGQAYQINHFLNLVDALNALENLDWNTYDFTNIQKLQDKYGSNDTIIITAQEHNALIQYINQINTQLPLFYSILETMVEKQEEQVINIKLPEQNEFSFKSLSDINTRLDKLFKEINIDGEYTFKGFDVGTSWYEVLLIGTLTYKFFISALKIAQEFFKAEKLFYESGEAKINYKAALLQLKSKEENIDDKDVRNYAQNVIKVRVENKIKEVVKELSLNGQTEHEAISKMTKAVTAITVELNKGVEFHLSLNPPTYAEEDKGKISINYEDIRKIEKEKAQPKQITDEGKTSDAE
ncbi:MAG: hypothetical protein E7013_06615 [Alphaproteobacteria bacterium]|nr:hypothetical protein [Alphaproteobacteria bacterium]